MLLPLPRIFYHLPQIRPNFWYPHLQNCWCVLYNLYILKISSLQEVSFDLPKPNIGASVTEKYPFDHFLVLKSLTWTQTRLFSNFAFRIKLSSFPKLVFTNSLCITPRISPQILLNYFYISQYFESCPLLKYEMFWRIL